MKHEDATAHLAEQIKRAKRAIGLERAAPAALPAVLLALGWAAFCLFGLQDKAPPLLGSLGSIAALLAIAVLIARGVRAWKKPTDQEARERLARDVDIDPHALDSLEDQPSRLDSVALALWAREQARAREAAEKLKPTKPRLALNHADPLRLRYVLLVALVVGIGFAGLQAPDRLARAFIPDPGPLLGDGPMEIEAWVAPADYTGAAPVSLSERIGREIKTPPSVEVTARVTGPVGAPYLVFDGKGGHKVTRFTKAADGAWEAKLALPGAGNLRIVRFHTKARWRIVPGADAKPAAKFVGKPAIEGDDVTFSWSASDDFGVRGLIFRVRPIDGGPGLEDAPPFDVPLDGPSSDPREAKGAEKIALLDNPYAGMKVEARVVAVDALGQEGESAPATLKLPEKIFLQPLARAAIEIRKEILHERRPYAPAPKLAAGDKPDELVWYDPLFGAARAPILTDEYDPRIERAPAAIRRAEHMIDALTSAPEDGYFQDTAVFLGFKGARAALDSARAIGETDEAADILWQVAMRAEYGDSADAKRALLEAQRALSEAIQNGASPDEIQRLTDSVRQAMNNYMQALRQEALRNGGQNQQSEEDTRQKTELSGKDIQDMLDEVQRLTNEGKTEEAQKLLEKLAQILDNLEIRLSNQSGDGQGGPGGDKGKADSELNQSVEGLSDTIGKQRSLKDETGKEGSKPGGDKAGKGQELGQRQQALRRALEDARKRGREGGSDAEDLGKAADSMSRAEEQLRRGDFTGAEKSQDDALRALRAGADRLSQELLRRQDKREGRDKPQPTGAQDPLGRNLGAGNSTGDEVTVPEGMERQRARDILDELRKRAQDPNRPEAEREYLRRLLERFAGF